MIRPITPLTSPLTPEVSATATDAGRHAFVRSLAGVPLRDCLVASPGAVEAHSLTSIKNLFR